MTKPTLTFTEVMGLSNSLLKGIREDYRRTYTTLTGGKKDRGEQIFLVSSETMARLTYGLRYTTSRPPPFVLTVGMNSHLPLDILRTKGTHPSGKKGWIDPVQPIGLWEQTLRTCGPDENIKFSQAKAATVEFEELSGDSPRMFDLYCRLKLAKRLPNIHGGPEWGLVVELVWPEDHICLYKPGFRKTLASMLGYEMDEAFHKVVDRHHRLLREMVDPTHFLNQRTAPCKQKRNH